MSKNVRVRVRALIAVDEIRDKVNSGPKLKSSTKQFRIDVPAVEMPYDDLLERITGIQNVILYGNVVASNLPPVGITNDVTGLTHNTVTLRATVISQNISTAVAFQYGTTKALGSTAPAAESPVQSVNPVDVTLVIAGLTPNTTYYYRVRCVNTTKTTYGLIKSFKTKPAP